MEIQKSLAMLIVNFNSAHAVDIIYDLCILYTECNNCIHCIVQTPKETPFNCFLNERCKVEDIIKSNRFNISIFVLTNGIFFPPTLHY